LHDRDAQHCRRRQAARLRRARTAPRRSSRPRYKRIRFNTLKLQQKIGEARSRPLASCHRTKFGPPKDEIEMKKLATLIGTLALVSTLSLTGCKKKEEAATEAPKTTEPAAPAAPTEPAAVAPTEPAPTAPAAPAAAGDMPAACTELKAALEKLAACAEDKAPAAVKDAYKSTWTGIETSMAAATTPEAKTAVGASCQASIDTLKTAAAGCL
jgi:hypothetical protein